MSTDFSHLSDPGEREWLTNVEPLEVVRNAHRFYDFLRENGLHADSYTRELAFTKAADALGIDYDVLYDAWLDEEPATEARTCRCEAERGSEGGHYADCSRNTGDADEADAQ